MVLRGIGTAAQQRLDARQQLGEGERLGEVVVAAGLEPLDAVIDAAQRRQHQHRGADALGAQLLDDRQPVELRQHAVGDDEIEVALGGAEQAIAAVGGVIDGIAALAQPLDQEARRLGVILDEQYVHGATE